MSEPLRMSKEGASKLEAELKRLKYTERPKIVAEIDRARQLGDLSENAEYHAAKEAQGHLERKISELEHKISRIQVVDTDSIPTDKVYLYAKVLVKDYGFDEEVEFTIVPPEEAKPDEDIISVDSPVARGLLGKAVGETIEVSVPAGTMKYEVLKISR